jgi:hypothetical protein
VSRSPQKAQCDTSHANGAATCGMRPGGVRVGA